MVVCEVIKYPEFDDESTEFGENFYHEYYYSISAECYDGMLMFAPVEHFRECMERLEIWKSIVPALGGGYITLYRIWDKYIEDEDYEPDIEAVFEVYDDAEDEELMAMIDDD